MTNDFNNRNRERTSQEIADSFFASAKNSTAIMNNTIVLLKSKEDITLNEIVKSYFEKDKNAFWWSLDSFIEYIIEKISEFIQFGEYLSKNSISWEEDESKYKSVCKFEDDYHKILYYWQIDPIVIREEYNRNLKLEEKIPLIQKVKWLVKSLLD